MRLVLILSKRREIEQVCWTGTDYVLEDIEENCQDRESLDESWWVSVLSARAAWIRLGSSSRMLTPIRLETSDS